MHQTGWSHVKRTESGAKAFSLHCALGVGEPKLSKFEQRNTPKTEETLEMKTNQQLEPLAVLHDL